MTQKLKITINDNNENLEFHEEQGTKTIITFLNYIENSNTYVKEKFLNALDKDYKDLYKKGGNKRIYIDKVNRYENEIINDEAELKEKITNKLMELSNKIAEKRNIPPSTTYFTRITQKRTFLLNANYSISAHFRNLSRLFSDIEEINVELIDIASDESITAEEAETKENSIQDTIFFGPPGTGKSYKFKDLENEGYIYRITFHPEYTYSDFVGQYKPVIGNHIESHINLDREVYEVNGQRIEKKKPIVLYDFVPGVFTKAILKSFQEPETDVYLIIEEINRGNCAAIFGDIFQLLDRDNDSNSSEFPINIPEELLQYIKNISIDSELGEQEVQKIIDEGKIFFPPNFHIYATMNTSDQSLFPMDSAFKRRWQMEYIPIDYNEKRLQGSYFILGNQKYDWLKFLNFINDKISLIGNNEDKQMGQWFPSFNKDNKDKQYFTEKTFKNKILSYLFFDVFKFERSKIFKRQSFSQIIKCNSLEEIFKDYDQ